MILFFQDTGDFMIFKSFSYLMTLFFIMSIVVQFNDPDGLAWMLVYGAILIATLFTIFKRNDKIRWVLYPLLLVYGIGIFQWSGSFAHTSLDAFMAVVMKNIEQEEVRELWGLVICFIWAIVLTINSLKYDKE
jgi:hypothetical protein